MSMEVVNQIGKILQEEQISHFVDPRRKTWAGNKPYFGIYTTRTCRKGIFYHYYTSGRLDAVIPRKWTPEYVYNVYAISGDGDPNDFKSDRSPHYYALQISETNGLLDGRYSLSQKKRFIVDVARVRT